MKRTSTLFLQTVVVLIGIVAFALLLWEPQLEGRNAHASQFEIYFNDPFLMLVYAGSIPFFIALHQALRLLRYIREEAVFSRKAVTALRTIKYCAVAIIGFVAVEEFIIILNHGDDDAAGAFFIGILITLGSIVIATAAALFERILQNAVEIQSENELTV